MTTSPDTPHVRIRLLVDGIGVPTYAKPGDAGCDLTSRDDYVLRAGERAIIPTGIAIALPEGYAAFVHPRSGLAAKHGITVLNTPGTIDAGYRGEICVILHNTDRKSDFEIRRGDRIAQLVIQRVAQARFDAVDELDATERGHGGFGSTGIAAS